MNYIFINICLYFSFCTLPVSTGLCELKACNKLSVIEKANFSKVYLTSSDTSLPECDDSGIFKSRQCQATGCKCVDQYGQATEGNNDGSCKGNTE